MLNGNRNSIPWEQALRNLALHASWDSGVWWDPGGQEKGPLCGERYGFPWEQALANLALLVSWASGACGPEEEGPLA